MKIISKDKKRNKDRRHTTKPYTENMWKEYEYLYFRLKNEQLARKYNVSIKTIYKWNTEMRKKWKEKNISWFQAFLAVEYYMKEK